ncbi:MAG: hypothetical protein FWH48_05080 [Oscillospiraceae bacterium]|nr:hypothetical protein [Oscillospiraceae bacterium]
MDHPDKLFLLELSGETNAKAYDEATLAACLQGIYNREAGPGVYLLSKKNPTPKYWLEKFTTDPKVGWLSGREIVNIDLFGLCELALPYVKKIIIWDPAVNASFNVAFTIAGVEDGVVLSPDYYELIRPVLGISDIVDLRGVFTGEISGSKKNDAYLWAIENYLAKGLCSNHWLCLYSDPFEMRKSGNIGYVNTRDWCIYNRAFVYDLSPWGDEAPLDDSAQVLGRDLETYKLMLAEQLKQTKGENMTEIAGFFNFLKYSNVPGHEESRHEPVPTEWESVFVMSPYNCYQNTVASDCYNQSLHSQFPFAPLKQSRPEKAPLENACYLGIQMCDYDSATPLYDFMRSHWDDPKRGEVALSWGINPNLIESYPDIITYFYNTATKDKDVFVADASAAGYFNPSRIQDRYWDMVVEHNRRFYELTDMTMTPMVLDWEPLSDKVLDQLTKFSPDGLSWIIMDLHSKNPKELDKPKIHNDVMVDEMLNNVCNGGPVDEIAKVLAGIVSGDTPNRPAFHYIRIVWQNPSYIIEIIEALKKLRPDLDIRLPNTYEYFRLHKQFLKGGQ